MLNGSFINLPVLHSVDKSDKIFAIGFQVVSHGAGIVLLNHHQLSDVAVDHKVQHGGIITEEKFLNKKMMSRKTEVRHSQRGLTLSPSISLRACKSFFPNCSISSAVCTPSPWALTFFRPCKAKANYKVWNDSLFSVRIIRLQPTVFRIFFANFPQKLLVLVCSTF